MTAPSPSRFRWSPRTSSSPNGNRENLARRATLCLNVSMTTVAISLQDEDRQFLEEVVKSGRYLSESEVVAEALADFRVREAIRRAKLDELRAKVEVGIEQADRGDFVEFNAEDVKRE